MKRRYQEISSILAIGGSVVLDAAHYSQQELCALAAAASVGKSRLILRSIPALATTEQLMAIAAAGKRCVEFDLYHMTV